MENPGGDCGWGDIKGPRVYILECLSCQKLRKACCGSKKLSFDDLPGGQNLVCCMHFTGVLC